MKKFRVNIDGNYNIYGEVIPINAFYGQIGDTIYYCCITSLKDVRDIEARYPKVDGVLPLPVYTWEGQINGFVLSWRWDNIAKTIYEQANKRHAWNNGVKKDITYGMGKTTAEKTSFMAKVERNHKTRSIKAGSKYHAKHSYSNHNEGEIAMSCGECIISRTFNTGRCIPYKE